MLVHKLDSKVVLSASNEINLPKAQRTHVQGTARHNIINISAPVSDECWRPNSSGTTNLNGMADAYTWYEDTTAAQFNQWKKYTYTLLYHHFYTCTSTCSKQVVRATQYPYIIGCDPYYYY